MVAFANIGTLALAVIPKPLAPVKLFDTLSTGILAPSKVDEPVPPLATGMVLEESYFVATAVAMLLNSVSISVPFTILLASPVVSASLAAKLTVLV